ncbi:ROK family protein [Methanoculleus chikugoensis]|uniref:ROK family protein n=1 Tax=Methanoculleus chikugoensis TaxID=118126 RepID=UPI000A841957|nr:ROK family protein [Methanoculleus chikugoensis]
MAGGVRRPAGSFDHSSTRAIFDAARAEDPVALAFMEALGEVNARGVSAAIVAYNPEVIVFDGPLARYYGDIVIRHMEPFIDRYLALPRLVVSELAGRARSSARRRTRWRRRGRDDDRDLSEPLRRDAGGLRGRGGGARDLVRGARLPEPPLPLPCGHLLAPP